MANIKAVDMAGVVPFNATDDPEFCTVLGKLNSYGAGIEFTWGRERGWEPNEHGGKTLMVEFWIGGEEAVGWGFLDRVAAAVLACGGSFDRGRCLARDAEDGGPMLDLSRWPKSVPAVPPAPPTPAAILERVREVVRDWDAAGRRRDELGREFLTILMGS